MARYILKRLLWMIFTFFTTALVIFTIMYFSPGDPARAVLGSGATLDEIANMRHNLGVDQPFFVQLGQYFWNLVRLDFGTSWKYSTPILSELLPRIPRSMLIGGLAAVINLPVGILLGIFAGTHGGRWQDYLTMGLCMLLVSAPAFWLALLMISLFAVELNWLPPYGIGGIQYYILPVASGCLGGIAANARQMRSSILEVYRADFITTARAKGQIESKVISKHMLPNAMMPMITTVGGILSNIIAGSAVTESIFAIPGVGMYMLTAINSRDYPVIRACVLFFAIFTAVVMLIIDLIYAFLDPRIKAQYSKKR